MTVEELIMVLKKHNPKAHIMIGDRVLMFEDIFDAQDGTISIVSLVSRIGYCPIKKYTERELSARQDRKVVELRKNYWSISALASFFKTGRSYIRSVLDGKRNDVKNKISQVTELIPFSKTEEEQSEIVKRKTIENFQWLRHYYPTH